METELGEEVYMCRSQEKQEIKLEELEPITKQLENEIGRPAIRGIKRIPRNVTPFSVTRFLNRVFGEYKEPKNNKKSPWRRYAELNLKGLLRRNRPEILNAIRFGHLIIAAGGLPEKEEIKLKIEEVFKEGFPWDNVFDGYDDGLKKVREIIERDGVEFIDEFIFDENNNLITQTKEKKVGRKEDLLAPVVINFIQVEINDEQKRRLVNFYLSKRPFVIIIDKEGEYNTFHLISNHEFLDGVPAAYYLRRIIDSLGLTMADFAKIDTNSLNNILKRADLIEANFDEENNLVRRYGVCSFVLSDELVTNIVNLYLEAIEKIKGRFSLSFENFFQMVLFYFCEVDGLSVRGGTLKFYFNALEQLGFHPVGDVRSALAFLLKEESDLRNLLNLLIETKYPVRLSPDEAEELKNLSGHDLRIELLKRCGFIEESETGSRFTLFLNGDLVREIIGRVAELPKISHRIANEISKVSRLAFLLTGQVMTSNVPPIIKNRGRNLTINLGGIGGPALTEWQEAAFTFLIDRRIGFDDQGNFGYYDLEGNFHKLIKSEDGKWYEVKKEDSQELPDLEKPFNLKIILRRKYKN